MTRKKEPDAAPDGGAALQVDGLTREQRQALVANWCAQAFGPESLADRRKRALRLLEEALELYQAEGGDAETAAALAAHVFARPPGEPAQELGGVSVTLLSYCEAAGLSASACEAAEIERVLKKSLGQVRARYQEKIKAGF